MGNFVNICGPVVADTLYIDGDLAARDIAATLPEIAYLTTTLQARGNWDVPLQGLFENMELAITKIGIDAGIGKMAKTGMRRLELRSVQSVQQVDGESKNQSIKVFATGLSNKIPGGSLEIGSAIENEMTYSLKRYQIFVDGEELVCIDRMGECRIMGKSITSGIDSLL